MPRINRPLIAGAAVSTLLVGAAPVAADNAPAAPAPITDAQDIGLPSGIDLPVAAMDVTDADNDLRDTRNEVTVLVDRAGQAPEVAKLRAGSAAAAARLVDALDAAPGVVAGRTVRLRSFATGPEPLSSQQWNLDMVAAAEAWPVSKGNGIVVAVIDTGVDHRHADLDGRVLPEIDLLPQVDPAPSQNGHGTRVASIVAAAINDVGIAGVAPRVKILPVEALDPEGFGDSSTVARAIIAAVDAGAQVINLSLGGPDRDPALDEACAYAHKRGAVVVAAGGNSYLTGNGVQYPAGSPKVVGVSSVDSAGLPSAFANTGSHIDLAAPGENILAAIPSSTGMSYNRESGTSFSAPHVAGAVALMLAANPALSAGDAATMVQLTADDRSRDGRDPRMGFGLLRADRAVEVARLLAKKNFSVDARLKLTRLNAKPEPGRRGLVSTFVTRVRMQRPDGIWRNNPIPTPLRVEFKASGTRGYRYFAKIASGQRGLAVLKAVPPKNGRWRARVKQPDGTWTASSSDYLRVLR